LFQHLSVAVTFDYIYYIFSVNSRKSTLMKGQLCRTIIHVCRI